MAGLGSGGSTAGPLTRSRTNLFLSYRDSAIRQPPLASSSSSVFPSARPDDSRYWDEDDEYGVDGRAAESKGLLSDEAASGPAGSSSWSRRGSGLAPRTLRQQQNLPPKWVDVSDAVEEVLEQVKPKSELRVDLADEPGGSG